MAGAAGGNGGVRRAVAGLADLPPKKAAFILAWIQLGTIPEAAKSAGVKERTAYHWSVEPEVLKARRDVSRQAIESAMERLSSLMNFAVGVVRNLAEFGKQEGTRLAAARTLLESAPKVAEFIDVSQRLADLERRLAARDARPVALVPERPRRAA